jgi:hypothetical protein
MDAVILIDVLDSHRRMMSRQRLSLRTAGPPLLVGRDLACDVVVNDRHVAPRHLEVTLGEDGVVHLTDLNTVNGLIVHGERIRRATLTQLPDSEVQIGRSRLRIRSSLETLAPEQADHESLRVRHREYGVMLAGSLLCMAFAALSAWTESPDQVRLAFASNVLLGGSLLGAWFLFWVGLGRVVRGRPQWLGHAAIALGAAGVSLWLAWGTEVAVFVTGVPRLQWLGGFLGTLIVSVALYLHVRIATRLTRPTVAMLAGVLPLVGVSAYLWFMTQRLGEDVDRIAAPGEIYPPTWSKRSGIRPEKFLDEAVVLRDRLDQKIAEDRLRQQRSE